MPKRPLFWFCIVLLAIMGSSVSMARIQSPDQSHYVFSPDGRYLAKLFHTEEQTWVRIVVTDNMETVAQWQIPDFQPQTIAFSPHDSRRLLIADGRRILVYRLTTSGRRLIYIQPEIQNRQIVDAGFDSSPGAIVWSTPTTLMKADLESRRETKIGIVNRDEGVVNDFAPAGNGRYAVTQTNNSTFYLFTPKNPHIPKELRGHRSPLAAVFYSSVDNQLYSLDESQELLIWDLETGRIQRRLQLGDLEDPSRIRGIGLDSARSNLMIQTQSDPGKTGKKYALSDLNKGIVRPERHPISITASGRLYSNTTTFEEKTAGELRMPAGGRIEPRRTFSFSRPERTDTRFQTAETSYYELAKIEADNDNFEAALNFIKKIPLNDPYFKESRELRKWIMQQIELKNTLEAAVNQYQTGNYKSAKILLENILAKNPDQPVVKRYLELTEDKLSSGFGLKLALILALLAILGGLGYYTWRYRPETVKRLKTLVYKPKTHAEKPEDANPLRTRFIYKLDETRKLLRKAISLDPEGKLYDRWLEITTALNQIEQRAKRDDRHLSNLLTQLDKQKNRILKLVPAARKFMNQQAHGEGDEQSKRAENEKRSDQSKGDESQKTASAGKKGVPNYYEVLGVSEKATDEEIKKAYRKRMRDYHPDKHNASDFEWVKDEASRMTRLIQEAYEVLSNPEKRRQYTP